MRSEYRGASAIRTAPGGTILITAPRDGKFHVGFLFYDQPGTERLEIRRGGKRLGAAVANKDDNRTELLLHPPGLRFQGRSQRLELCTARTPTPAIGWKTSSFWPTPEIRPDACWS